MTTPTPSWYVGIDLAWAHRNRTGLAAVDAGGTLVDLAELRTDDEIVRWLTRFTSEPCLVAIDAPIIVTNPTGRRACEAALARHFGRYDAGAHPSNTGKPEFANGSRALQLTTRLGLDVDPASTSSRRAIEVYPHPATVVLFDLPRTIKYKHKPGRGLDFLRTESLRLMGLIESLERAPVPLQVTGHHEWRRIRAAVESAQQKSQLKKSEDMVDAVLCAYVALYSVRRPDLTHTYGDAHTGYIVTPITAAIRQAGVSPHTRAESAAGSSRAGSQVR